MKHPLLLLLICCGLCTAVSARPIRGTVKCGGRPLGGVAVTDGYTQLGFIGAEEIPGVVRYVTGFLQGAEYAAEQQGLTVDLRTWFAGTYSASDDTTNRMLDWCNNGTTLLFVNGGNLIASAIDAAKETTSGRRFGRITPIFSIKPQNWTKLCGHGALRKSGRCITA